MKKYIIDRIENNIAVCESENKIMVNIKVEDLPKECKEGDCIIKGDDGVIYIDNYETRLREEKAKRLLDRLRK